MKTEKQAMDGPKGELSEKNGLQRKKGQFPCPWVSKFTAQNFSGFLCKRTFSVHCWGDSNNVAEEMARNK